LTSQSSYPCSASVTVTCQYIEGSASANDVDKILWDKINIYLPSSFSDGWHILLPLFMAATNNFLF